MNLELLKYENNEIRTAEKNGEMWWFANDVCKALCIKNVSKALNRVNTEDRDDITSSDTVGRKNRMIIVNESGLYDLILSSKKDEAKKFRRWVTKEVLPSIRKTGEYIAPTTKQVAMSMGGSLVQQAEMFLAIAKQQEALALEVSETRQIAQEALEATKKDLGHRSIIGYARDNNIFLENGRAGVIGKQISTYCKEHKIEYHTVPDARWGKINVYPVFVLNQFKSLFLEKKVAQ